MCVSRERIAGSLFFLFRLFCFSLCSSHQRCKKEEKTTVSLLFHFCRHCSRITLSFLIFAFFVYAFIPVVPRCSKYILSHSRISQTSGIKPFATIQPDTFSKGTMIALMLLAALLWGVTNPLLKHYSKGMISGGSAKDDLNFLVRRPKYLLTQVVNLSGSVVFFYSLREVDVSVGSIVVNSLAFVITVLMSVFALREGPLRPRTAAGCLLVMIGTALCTYSSSR